MRRLCSAVPPRARRAPSPWHVEGCLTPCSAPCRYLTVGTVETRVPRAGLPGPITSSEIFAKDQALQAWRGSPCLARPRRGFFPRQGTSLQEGAKPKAWRGLRPHGDFFLAKGALSPRQGAHGLCALCRVTGVPAHGDASAVVAILVYEAVNKAAPSKGVARVATLVIRRPSATPLQIGRAHV